MWVVIIQYVCMYMCVCKYVYIMWLVYNGCVHIIYITHTCAWILRTI